MPGRREGIRLHVHLARCGIASRRTCEKYIMEGRVVVNGATITRHGFLVVPEDVILFDGQPVRLVVKKIYIAINKPEGYVCTQSDPQGRPTARQLFEASFPERLFHVGRLDLSSQGLIFYTNDGEFSRIVTHPACGVEKEYFVECYRPISARFLEDYRAGLTIEGELYQLKSYRQEGPNRVTLVLTEGKNREIRTVFKHGRFHVRKLFRKRIGCVTTAGIPMGGFRSLTESEIAWFFKLSGGLNDGRRN